MSSAAPLPHRRDAGGTGAGAGEDDQLGSSLGGSARGGVGPDVVGAVAPGRSEAEEDPTGVRALLASLPDPGPMPPTLVRRIADSLAAEQARTSGASRLRSAGEQPVAEHALTSTRPPLHPRRTAAGSTRPSASPASRPRWQRPVLAVAGAAAAAAVVGALGINLVHESSSSSGAGASAANLNSVTPPRTAASPQSRAAAGADAKSGAGSAAGSAAGPAGVRLAASATSYTAANLADRSRRLLAMPSPATSSSATPPVASAGAVATADGAKHCLRALGVPAAHRVVVDVATYEGQPAAILVVAGAGGAGGGATTYVVRRSCRTGHPGVLHPPLVLP